MSVSKYSTLKTAVILALTWTATCLSLPKWWYIYCVEHMFKGGACFPGGTVQGQQAHKLSQENETVCLPQWYNDQFSSLNQDMGFWGWLQFFFLFFISRHRPALFLQWPHCEVRSVRQTAFMLYLWHQARCSTWELYALAAFLSHYNN